MNRFRRLCRRGFPGIAFAVLWLCAATAGAEDQPKTPPPPTSATETAPPAKPTAQPAVPAKAATPKPKPKPIITAKKEGEGILGKQVYGTDGADMGLVTNVLVDHAGNPIAVVIDFGGFLGVGTRKIAIDWHLMQFHPNDQKKPVTLNLEKGQLKSAPTYDPDKPLRVVGAPLPEPKPPAKGAPAAKPAEAPKAPATPEKPAPETATPPAPTSPNPAPTAPSSPANTGK